MKAALVVAHGQVEICEVPVPEPGPTEALVRIEACGLCGTTDRHLVEGTQAHHPADWYPAILGHEAVGTVIEIGREVRKFQVGDRVTRPVAIWPGTCRDGLYSAWGGFAEYGIVRDGIAEADYTEARQHTVARELSLEEAVLAVSLSEVASWMEKLGDIAGRCVVIGGTGFAACAMAQCAQARRADPIVAVGRNAAKFDGLRRNGATHALFLGNTTAAEIRELNRGEGADWFLDAAGHQEVFEAGLGYLRAGGRAAIYGAPAGFAYRLPLGTVGGDFSVHYLAPNDDVFFDETGRRILSGALSVKAIHSHTWTGLQELPKALKEQAEGHVLKGLVSMAG